MPTVRGDAPRQGVGVTTTGNDPPTPVRPLAARGRRAERPRAVRRVALRELGAASASSPLPKDILGELATGPSDLVPLSHRVGSASGAVVVPVADPVRRLLPRRARQPRQPSLLADERFRAYWLSRVTSQTAQNALIYAFLLIVADRAERATVNSLFVLCSIVPAIIFGLPAGIAVDQFPRRPMLIGLNVLRFLFVALLVWQPPSLAGIFATTLALWTIHQFYAPAETAILVGMVPRDRFAQAQAFANLAMISAQLLGLVILAPLLLKTVGPQVLFAVCAALFVVGAGFSAMLPRLDEAREVLGRTRQTLRRTLLEGWRGLQSDPVTFQALVADVLIGIGLSALLVIAPLYLGRVLATPSENSVFVFAPAALGLVIGLRYAPGVGRILGEQRVATAGLISFAGCVAAVGLVEQVRVFLVDGLRLPIDQIADLVRIPSLVLITMLISIPAGTFTALVMVTARTLLLGHTAPTRRGQTVATSQLLVNLGALVPTLLAGIAADLVGVERVAVAIAVLLIAGCIAARAVVRPLPLASPSPSA